MKRSSKIAFNILAVSLGIGIISTTQILRNGGVEALTEKLPAVFGFSGPESQTGPRADEVDIAAGTEPAPPDTPQKNPAGLTVVQRLPEAPQTLAQRQANCGPAQQDSGSVVIGDRINLRFFEKVALARAAGADTGTETAPQQDIAYERLDLSGTFDVGGDGTLSLPLVGRVNVLGQSLDCAERLIAGQMVEMTQTTTVVNANFTTRPPVLVRGAVRAPGSYAFTPGMTVETLLALAGSPTDGGIDAARRNIALNARSAELEQAIAGVLIERRRIEAALNGTRTIELNVEESDAVTGILGKARIDAEAAALDADITAQEAKRIRSQSEVADADAAIIDMQRQLQVVGDQLDEMYVRRDDLTDLKNRRLISSAQLDTVVFNIMTLEGARMDTNGALLRLRASRNLAEQTAAVDKAARRQMLSQQIRDLAEERDGLVAQLDTLSAEIAFSLRGGQPVGGDLPFQVTINRPAVDGLQRINASMATRLWAGDLATVTILMKDQPSDLALLERGTSPLLNAIEGGLKNE
ncbi:polysaccharide biosynthesis/export family protein [Pseudogemmobacter sp. W21_MBD1_M6]|uniref:polysaccharide biosynthesis/export family protein n=1 Tax=Pseudogemmobacter sp. W21_MBD1_M6 TaxID=3240271 RepID=UPI003F958FD1